MINGHRSWYGHAQSVQQTTYLCRHLSLQLLCFGLAISGWQSNNLCQSWSLLRGKIVGFVLYIFGLLANCTYMQRTCVVAVGGREPMSLGLPVRHFTNCAIQVDQHRQHSEISILIRNYNNFIIK